jgi:PII-like signaling protein
MRQRDEQVLMRIFLGERQLWHRRPLFMALLELFRARGIAGTTVLRGIAGFGASSVIHTMHTFALSEDLPIVIEVIDDEGRIDAVLPEALSMLTTGLVTLEKVQVLRRLSVSPPAAPPGPQVRSSA